MKTAILTPSAFRPCLSSLRRLYETASNIVLSDLIATLFMVFIRTRTKKIIFLDNKSKFNHLEKEGTLQEVEPSFYF